MAKRLQHDMNTDPNYAGWFAGMIAALAIAGLVVWSMSGGSDVASDKSAPPTTVGAAPVSGDAPPDTKASTPRK